MSLHNLPTTITPAEHTALYNAVMHVRLAMRAKADEARENRQQLSDADRFLLDNCETASLWLAAVAEKMFAEWDALPEGSHLKEAYAELVWTWSDRDLAAKPDAPEDGWNFAPPVRPE